MAYDENLRDRIRERLADEPDAVEKNMFGGVAFLLAGNMCVGVHRDNLIARVGPEESEAALAEPHTRVFDITGRPMKNWILVEPAGVEDDADLDAWIDRARDFARSLPPK